MHWIKTPPTTEPVTYAEAQAHLNVTGDTDKTLIESLIKAARAYVEKSIHRALITQTWVYARSDWPKGDVISLPGGPTLTLVGLTWLDTAGASTAFTDVILDTHGSKVVLAHNKTWPSGELYPVNPIQAEYTLGYGEAKDVPENVKLAMLLLIGHWYENREAVLTGATSKQIEFAVDALLGPERVFWHESG
jgi:uncharacterized phiE125 gp8 family phage protein